MWHGCKKALTAYKAQTKDEGVFLHHLGAAPGLADPADTSPEARRDWAVLNHWSVYGHQRLASSLVKIIEQQCPGWQRQREPAPCLESLKMSPDHYCVSDSWIMVLFDCCMCLGAMELIAAMALVGLGLATGAQAEFYIGFFIGCHGICLSLALCLQYRFSANQDNGSACMLLTADVFHKRCIVFLILCPPIVLIVVLINALLSLCCRGSAPESSGVLVDIETPPMAGQDANQQAAEANNADADEADVDGPTPKPFPPSMRASMADVAGASM